MNRVTKEFQYGDHRVILETGRLARQATGAVLVTMGETVVLCTVVGLKTTRPGIDFFPLTVNYQEKTYAAGKIPGGFFRREGRPSEKETLTCRLIDRPIRPLFPKGFKNEVRGHLHRHVGGQGHGSGYRIADRYVGGIGRIGSAVQRTDRAPRASATTTVSTC